MQGPNGEGIAEGGARVNDHGRCDHPLARHGRAESRCRDQQDTETNPIDGTRLPDQPQQPPCPGRFDARSRKYADRADLGERTVQEGDHDGQLSRRFESQIPHRQLHTELSGSVRRPLLSSIQCCMVPLMAEERLSAQDWIDAGLRSLARQGFGALKADLLAQEIGVSRGSFYWHFESLASFQSRLIEYWKRTATEAIIADLERYGTPRERIDALLRRAFGRGGSLEIRMRTWAEGNREAALAVRDIDRRRRTYIEQLLEDSGVAPKLAGTRAQLLYWTYLGAALSRSKLMEPELEETVAELRRIGLDG
jgi:AcrR family transcriptional regulator